MTTASAARRTGSGRPGAPTIGASPRATTNACAPPSTACPGRELEPALGLLEMPEGFVQIAEQRLQNFRRGRARARNAILEQCRDACAVFQHRIASAQP